MTTARTWTSCSWRTRETKDLTTLTRLAREVLELVSARTEQGVVFRTDARLRPDGEKGLLVNTLSAYEEYYRQRGAALGDSVAHAHAAGGGGPGAGRPIPGAGGGADELPAPGLPLAAYAPDWKQKIHQMRMRIEKERTPAGKDDLAIKTGKGGLMDAEFIAQTLCLENGWQEANTLRALERGRAAGVLPDADKLIAELPPASARRGHPAAVELRGGNRLAR